jgi:outer membrane lipoprotein-sorting protein
MRQFSRYRALVVIAILVPLTGCLFRSRKVERQVSTAPLKSATQAELIAYINTEAAKIQSMQATVDIDASVGGVKKGRVTDYQQIRGYVLARKPAMLRMIGLLPVVRNQAFDMVSDGKDFKLWIPPKNRFVMGRNDIETHNTEQPLENLRPQRIYDALLLREVNPENEIAVMENSFEIVTDAKRHQVEQADYEIEIIGKGEQGWYLERKIVFSRTDLLPHRQFVWDQNGDLVTDSRYEDYKDYSGVSFPSQIEIWWPQQEYDITLTIIKLQLNEPMPDDKFALEQPPGAQVVHLNQPQTAASPGPPGGNRR